MLLNECGYTLFCVFVNRFEERKQESKLSKVVVTEYCKGVAVVSRYLLLNCWVEFIIWSKALVKANHMLCFPTIGPALLTG